MQASYTFLIGPDPLSYPESLRRMYFNKGAIVAMLALAAAACNRGRQAPPGAQGLPPAAVQLGGRADQADRGRDRIRRHAEVAALDDGAAADRRADHADLREVGRPREAGRAAHADRSAPPAGGGVEPGGRARGARGGRQLRAAAGAARHASSSRPAPSANRNWSRRETALRTAEANLQALQAQVQQQQVQLRYFTVTAPTAGIVGDVPVRVGNQVTPQTC